jgi:hypothetical protein
MFVGSLFKNKLPMYSKQRISALSGIFRKPGHYLLS